MTCLNQFRDDIKISGGEDIEAFRMDNTGPIPDMRKYVGLGTCNCCDRFFVKGDEIFIVEETRLGDTIEEISQEYSYLSDAHKHDMIKKCIRQENYVKVYGAMLVLCRLARKCREAAELMGDKKHNFWFIPEQTMDKASLRYWDNLGGDLRSVLTGKVVNEVEIVLPNFLADT
ncbi:MAG: hypothetical protein OXU40_02130 [Nitrospira sp.]|nr:hypothetical protein [Nitrospira sp.]